MGRGLTEITLADLHSVIGRYSNVIWMNDPDDTDLMKTIIGQPRTVVINLAQLLNLSSGDIQGDAIAIDELEATEIADGAVRGRELAETPSLFQTATEVIHNHDTGTGAVLIAANNSGEGDRLVLCQVEVTETFVATAYDVDVGSGASLNGMFDDMFKGLGTLQINETLVGSYLLPEGEDLVFTETVAFSGDTQGQFTFRFITVSPAAGSIPGALLADDAIGVFEDITATNVAWNTGSPAELLASHATDDRLCLIMGIATVTAAGTPDFDVGSEVTAINAAFDQLSAGTWVKGERWIGACMLPAGEKLQVTITGAPSAGAVDFYVIPITVVGSGTTNLFVGGTDFVQAFDTGAGTILAANAAGEGDRLVVVQAEVTTAWAGTDFELNIGSTTTPAGLFADIFGGGSSLPVGRSVIGTYLLPEGEPLAVVETLMTMTAGVITFRILHSQALAGSIPGALLADEGVNFPDGITPEAADYTDATVELLASSGTLDRVVLVTAIVTETALAAGIPQFDVGAGAGVEVFSDIAAGSFVIGERYFGSMVLPSGSALNCTVTPGAASAGEIDFYVQVLAPTVQTAQIIDAAVTTAKINDAAVTGVKLAAVGSLFDGDTGAAITVVVRDYGDGDTHTLLAANAATAGDRLLLVQAHVTEVFALTSYEWDVGSTAASNGLFDDLFAGDPTIGLRESEMSAYILPAGEALVLDEVGAQVDGGAPTGKVTFRILDLGAITTARIAAGTLSANVAGRAIMAAGLFDAATALDKIAAAALVGSLLDNEAVGHFQDSGVMAAASTIGFGGGAAQDLLAADADNDRLCIVMGIATIASQAGVNDWDVGSETTDNDALFDNIAAGTWVAGDRWVGACMLPATEKLQVFLTTAGNAGSIDFYVIPLTLSVQTDQIADAAITGIKLAATPNLFQDPATEVTHDHDQALGSATLLAANVAGEGARLVVVQCEVTEAFAGVTDMDIDVGSATTPGGVFHDIFGGALNVALGETLVGVYLLPELEALVTTENAMANDTNGQFTFRTYVATPVAGSIPGALLANDAVYFPYGVAAQPVVHDGGNVALLALDATIDRIVLVTAIITETGDGTVDIDVGAGAGTEVFSDLALGNFVAGERYFGAMVLAAGDALNATIVTAGGAGEIDFYVTALTPLVAAANIDANAVTPDKVLDIAAESATAGVGIKMAMAEYTFANLAADAGMFGATSIPSGALVIGGYLEVVTALGETNGGGEVDVGLDLEGANDLLADTAWNGAPWSAPGFYDILPDMGGAGNILTTAPHDITISIVLNGATDIASGVIRVVLYYIEPKTGAV